MPSKSKKPVVRGLKLKRIGKSTHVGFFGHFIDTRQPAGATFKKLVGDTRTVLGDPTADA